MQASERCRLQLGLRHLGAVVKFGRSVDGGILICSRRGPGDFAADRLARACARRVGARRVHRIVDHGTTGGPDPAELARRCSFVLVVVDAEWLTAADGHGRRLLWNVDDPIHRAVAAALRAPSVRVVPILVDRVESPAPHDLPEDLRPLAGIQARWIRHDNAKADAAAIPRRVGVPPRRRRLLLGAVSGVVIAAVLGTGVALWPGDVVSPGKPRQTTDRDVVRNDAYTTGADPRAVAVEPTAIWVANSEDDTVTRIDRRSGIASAPVKVGDQPMGVAVDAAGQVWVANNEDGTVFQVDGKTRQIVRKISVGNAPTGVVVAAGGVWVAVSGAGTVVRLHPGSGKIIARIPVGRQPGALTFDGSALWVADFADHTVTRIRPADNGTDQVVAVGRSVLGIAAGAGALWAASPGDDRTAHAVLRIGLNGDHPIAAVEVGDFPAAVAVDGDSAWAALVNENRLVEIDMRSRQVVGVAPTGRRPSAVAVAGDSLWATGMADGTVTRLSRAQLHGLNAGARLRPHAVLTTVRVGNDPVGVVEAFGSIWVGNADDGTVTEVDAVSGRVRRTIPVGGSPHTLAAGADAIFVAVNDSHELAKIDHRIGKVVRRVPIPSTVLGMAASADRVWLTSADADVLVGVDSTSMAEVARVPVARRPLRVAVVDGAVWVASGGSLSESGGAVTKFDARTTKLLWTGPMDGMPGGGVVGTADGIFVSQSLKGDVIRLDPASGRETGRVSVGGGPLGLSADADRVWVVTAEQPTLQAIDLRELGVTARLPVCDLPQSVTVYAGDTWFTCTRSNSLLRLSPLH